MIPRLTDSTFYQAIQSSRPILVTFTAPIRCQHCREQKPALEAMLAEGQPTYIVDVEEPDTAQIEATLGGRGVPFSKIYANGQLIDEHLGKMNAGELMGFVQEGARLAAQMGSHRPQSPETSAYQHVAGPIEDQEAFYEVEETLEAPRTRQRAAGYRSLKGILSGFGRE